MEEGVHGLLGLHLRHARPLRHAIHDVEFNHFRFGLRFRLPRVRILSKGANTLRRDNRDAPRRLSRRTAEGKRQEAKGKGQKWKTRAAPDFVNIFAFCLLKFAFCLQRRLTSNARGSRRRRRRRASKNSLCSSSDERAGARPRSATYSRTTTAT